MQESKSPEPFQVLRGHSEIVNAVCFLEPRCGDGDSNLQQQQRLCSG